MVAPERSHPHHWKKTKQKTKTKQRNKTAYQSFKFIMLILGKKIYGLKIFNAHHTMKNRR